MPLLTVTIRTPIFTAGFGGSVRTVRTALTAARTAHPAATARQVGRDRRSPHIVEHGKNCFVIVRR